MIATQEAPRASTPLPAYKSHKTVRALRIGAINLRSDGSALIEPTEGGFAPFIVDEAYMRRNNPHLGGYYVTYEDGFRSFSPAEAFEKGYVPANHWGLPRSQEPKYTTSDAGRLRHRLTGDAIPDEEPVFILRAKDLFARGTLIAYREILVHAGADADHIRVVEDRIRNFGAFAEGFPERMRAPNSPLAVTTPFQGGQA